MAGDGRPRGAHSQLQPEQITGNRAALSRQHPALLSGRSWQPWSETSPPHPAAQQHGDVQRHKPEGLSGTHWCEVTFPAHGSTRLRGNTPPLVRQLPGLRASAASLHLLLTWPCSAQQSLRPHCAAQALGHGSSAARRRPSWGRPTPPGPARAQRGTAEPGGGLQAFGSSAPRHAARGISTEEKNSNAGRKTRRNLCAETFCHAELADSSAHHPR